GLEVELDMGVLAELLCGLDVQVALDGRVVHQTAIDHLEPAVVGLGLAVQSLLVLAGLLPAVEIFAVEKQREAGFEFELVSREVRSQQQESGEQRQGKQTSHECPSQKGW